MHQSNVPLVVVTTNKSLADVAETLLVLKSVLTELSVPPGPELVAVVAQHAHCHVQLQVPRSFERTLLTLPTAQLQKRGKVLNLYR